MVVGVDDRQLRVQNVLTQPGQPRIVDVRMRIRLLFDGHLVPSRLVSGAQPTLRATVGKPGGELLEQEALVQLAVVPARAYHLSDC